MLSNNYVFKQVFFLLLVKKDFSKYVLSFFLSVLKIISPALEPFLFVIYYVFKK
jgi:hypothetical protein